MIFRIPSFIPFPHCRASPPQGLVGATTRSDQRAGRVCAAGGRGADGGRGSWSEPFDDTTRRALREAAELLSEAQELARQQTLSELMGSWAADAAAETAQPDALQSSTSDHLVQAAVHQQPQPSSARALEAFWCEQGLSQGQAQQLLREVQNDPQLAAVFCNTQVLSQKLSSLGRVLPGVDVLQLVVRMPQVLGVPSSTAVKILVDLVNALPGCDVMDMVARQPRLLLVDAGGLPEQLQAIKHKLQQLHPSHMDRVVAGIIEENPELVLRMPYYLGDNVRLLDDLPIEIQNMMVLGDHGVGYLYRYWNNRLTERPSQSQWESGSTAA